MARCTPWQKTRRWPSDRESALLPRTGSIATSMTRNPAVLLAAGRFCWRAGVGYRWLVEGVVPARVVHRKAVAALGPGFAAAGFECRGASAAAVWQRPAGREFVVAWVQPTRSPDVSGWYGSRFIIELRRGTPPRAGVLGPGF